MLWFISAFAKLYELAKVYFIYWLPELKISHLRWLFYSPIIGHHLGFSVSGKLKGIALK